MSTEPDKGIVRSSCIFFEEPPSTDIKSALSGFLKCPYHWSEGNLFLQLNTEVFTSQQVLLSLDKFLSGLKHAPSKLTVCFASAADVKTFPGFQRTEEGFVFELDSKGLRRGQLFNVETLLTTVPLTKKQRALEEVLMLQDAACHYGQDPTVELTRRGLLVRTEMRGRAVLGPGLMRLYTRLEACWIERILNGFDQIRIPKVTSLDTVKTSNHVAAFGDQLHYVFTMKRQPEAFESLSNEVKVRDRVPTRLFEALSPVGVVTYGQCEALFPIFRRAHLNHRAFPIKLFDRSGPSMREEGNAVHGLSRLNEFHRIEAIWFQRKENVRGFKQLIRSRIDALFQQWAVKYRWLDVKSWTGCCAADLGTQDLEVYLPYCNRWLEVLSFNSNGDLYLKKFDIRVDVPSTSGCFGLGKDRLVHALLSQKGFDPNVWPTSLRQFVAFESPAWLLRNT